ncbi:MAG: hypothetical protein MMC23_004328 [Stictis urceolatum]|nr:hypothetical protein [Stictis urceolata]
MVTTTSTSLRHKNRAKDSSDPIKSSPPPPKAYSRTIPYSAAPAWMRTDPLILTSYRRPSPSLTSLLTSLFYPHNELLNTWTHLLPALYFFLALFRPEPYTPIPADDAVLRIYALGTLSCLLFSAIYHASNAHSCTAARRLVKLDYLGIVLSITGTSASATHAGLRARPGLQAVYTIICLVAGAGVFLVMLGDRDGPKAAVVRVVSFGCLMSAGCVPIVQALVQGGVQGVGAWPMQEIGVMLACYAGGAGVYLVRWPEKWWPERFDVLGASHQIFHVLVAVGQWVYWAGLRGSLGAS